MMDLIVIENSNQRCHLSGKVVLRREIIYNGSTPFTIDVHDDRIHLFGRGINRTCVGHLEIKTPTGELVLEHRTTRTSAIQTQKIDIDFERDKLIFFKREGTLILQHHQYRRPQPLSSIDDVYSIKEYIVIGEFAGITISAMRDGQPMSRSWAPVGCDEIKHHRAQLEVIDSDGVVRDHIQFDETFNLDQLNDKYVYRVQYFRNIGYVEGEEFTPTSLFGSFIECESE